MSMSHQKLYRSPCWSNVKSRQRRILLLQVVPLLFMYGTCRALDTVTPQQRRVEQQPPQPRKIQTEIRNVEQHGTPPTETTRLNRNGQQKKRRLPSDKPWWSFFNRPIQAILSESLSHAARAAFESQEVVVQTMLTSTTSSSSSTNDDSSNNNDDTEGGGAKDDDDDTDEGKNSNGKLATITKMNQIRQSVRQVATTASSSMAIAGLSSTSATVASAAMAAAAVEREQKEHLQQQQQQGSAETKAFHVDKKNMSIIKAARSNAAVYPLKRQPKSDEDWALSEVDIFTREGARLLSASFNVVSNSFGLVADVVRIAGDTAAGATGSSIKLMGIVVKSLSTTLDSAGSALEGRGDKSKCVEIRKEEDGIMRCHHQKKRKVLTSEMLLDRERKKYQGLIDYDSASQERHAQSTLTANTMNVAGQSVRLVGSVVRSFGDFLLFAGSATESLASSTAGVAEDVVRIAEHVAGSLSATFASEARQYSGRDGATASTFRDDEWTMVHPWHKGTDFEFVGGSFVPKYVTYGTDGDDDGPTLESKWVLAPKWNLRTISRLTNTFWSQFTKFVEFSSAYTEGVPSLSADLLGFMILSCVVVLFSRVPKKDLRDALRKPTEADSKKNESNIAVKKARLGTGVPMIIDVAPKSDQNTTSGMPLQNEETTLTMYSDMSENETSTSTSKTKRDSLSGRGPKRILSDGKDGSQSSPNIIRMLWLVVAGPWKVLFCVERFLWRLVTNRTSCILLVHVLGWLYLSRASQLRSAEIQRNAEFAGFRSAFDSLGSSSPSMIESVAWLNAALSQSWRVSHPLENIDGLSTQVPSVYPDFECRGMNKNLDKNEKCDCNRAPRLMTGQKFQECPYGGLEPYISSLVGAALIEALETPNESRPNDVAYISLHSFTLGSVPPIIRGAQLQRVDKQNHVVHLGVDLDLLLGDSSVVLDVKLSSLDYSLLPSTKLSINSFDVRMSMNLSVKFIPDYPFVSILKVSLATVPRCKVKVTPLSEDSGLRGVDLGSFPVVSNWIQNSIQLFLAQYASPRYIEVDLKALLSPVTVKAKRPSNLKDDRQMSACDRFNTIQSCKLDGTDCNIVSETKLPHLSLHARDAASLLHRNLASLHTYKSLDDVIFSDIRPEPNNKSEMVGSL